MLTLIVLLVTQAAPALPVPTPWPPRLGFAPRDTDVVAFVDVNVIPMDRPGVLEHQTVVVRSGQIVAVGPHGRVGIPDRATRIDGRGKYLMPGMGEMHGHLPSPNAGPEITENVLFLYVANGVTVVRGMQGTTAHLELKGRIARGELLGPRLWVPGPQLSGNSAPNPETGRRLVEEQHAAGFDHIKIQEGLSRETYDTIVATAQRLGMRFAGHVPNDVGVYRALEAGQASIDHLDNYVETVGGPDSATDRRIAEVVRATCAAGTWTVPTLALWETFLGTGDSASLANRPENRFMPPGLRSSWAQQLARTRQGGGGPATGGAKTVALRGRILKALQGAGCPIGFGTDSPQLYSVPGFSMHREMRSMEAAGLTRQQIIEAATRNVARYFGAEREFGTVAPGRRADLLLLEGNPLTDLGNVARRAGVMVGGRWLPEAEIQARLERMAAAYQ
ncbi:MAG: amidohydrolase family protein [Gemmatimonadales bacterium]